MEKEAKYRFGSGKFKPEKEPRYQEILREKESPHIIQLDLKSDDDSVVLDLETGTSGELELSLVSNSRCVSVDTFSPAPLGRKKKKSITVKTEIIKFRCSIYEKKLLKVKARKSGLTLSEYFRRVALEQKITARLTDEQISIYKMLVTYHNNFKSIGNMFKKRNPKLTETVHDLANEIKEHLKDFKSDR